MGRCYRVVTILYSTKRNWGFGIFHCPKFLGIKTRRFGNWICFHPQVKRGETHTYFCPLEIANINHWTTPVRLAELFNSGVWIYCKVILSQKLFEIVNLDLNLLIYEQILHHKNYQLNDTKYNF
jgi:hypothetical protein